MATKTLYVKDALAGTSAHGSLQDGGSAPTSAETAAPTGWVVAKTAPPNYAILDYGVKRGAGAWGTTAQPASGIDTTIGDCFRTENTLSGTFASGNWDVAFGVDAKNAGGTQDGRIRFRAWRSVNQDGSSATEITAATQVCATLTNVAVGVEQVSNLTTWNPGAVTLSNEYLFFQIAWEITGAATASLADIVIRVGSTCRIITPDFAADTFPVAPQPPFGWQQNANTLLRM